MSEPIRITIDLRGKKPTQTTSNRMLMRKKVLDRAPATLRKLHKYQRTHAHRVAAANAAHLTKVAEAKKKSP